MVVEYIFVYGSLRKRFSSPARKVLDKYAEFIGEATLQGKLYLIDWYPGVVLSNEPDDLVYGEVYKMIDREEVLTKLDRYEGCSLVDPRPHAFVREQMPVTLNDNEFMAWVYLYRLSISGKKRISTGDYMK